MLSLPENARQVLLQLVPASIVNLITCYVLYDNHPRDEKKTDVVVCTKMGEVREYFHRDLVSSLYIGKLREPSEIKILRNSRCELFYLVATGDELTILTHKCNKLEIQIKLTDVCRYAICDEQCSGKAVLRVVTQNGYTFLEPDDDFKDTKSIDFVTPSDASLVDHESPIVKHLMSKITESKHAAQCIQKTCDDFLKIRQSVAFATYKKIHPNLDDSIFQDKTNMMAKVLNIHIQKPWIKLCNKKIVIAYNICNRNQEILEDVHILLHGTSRPSLEYITKIFKKTIVPSFWKETESQMLKPNQESALVIVVKLKEMKDSVLSKVEFNGVMVFKKSGSECVLPIEDVHLSSMDTMGEQFDVLCTDPIDNNTMLAILASTEKTELLLRNITEDSTSDHLTFNIFRKYLLMEKIPNVENIVIFRKSPYHVLNGVMIILKNNGKDYLTVTVHSRSPSQVLALIHYIHDAVPYRIVTTTPDYKITAKNHNLSIHEDDLLESPKDTHVNNIYKNYVSSIKNRTALVLDYLDNSMQKMNQSKNTAILNKSGVEIDLCIQGEVAYKEFKKKMWMEASKGVKTLKQEVSVNSLLTQDIDMEL